MSFTNKAVLVTGGSAGIGAAIAASFAKEGANVIIVGRNEANLHKVAEDCEKIGKKPLIIKADLSKEDEVNSIVQKTIDTFGNLDVLVNNAGILNKGGILDNAFLNLYDEAMNVNLRSVIILTKSAIPYLMETKGNIINISSIAACGVKVPNFLAYRISKIALTLFTIGVASELAPFGVRANVISPGVVRTDIFAKAGIADSLTRAHYNTALNRILNCEEISDMVIYLASDRAKGITGSNIIIDNGELIKSKQSIKNETQRQ